MRTYLCHDSLSEKLVMASLVQDPSGVLNKRFRKSRDASRSDILFIRQEDLGSEILSKYDFFQLIEIDSHTSLGSIPFGPQVDDPYLLKFNVTSSCAYHCRLAKFFLDKLSTLDHGFSSLDFSAYDLPLHEAITNAIIHGNLELESSFSDLESMDLFYKMVAQRLADPKFSSRRITLEAFVKDQVIQISVTDAGKGHRFLSRDEHPSKAPHGRGFMLISAYTDGLAFADEGRTSTLTLNTGA